MTLDNIYLGTSPGNPVYVQGTSYDEAGWVTQRTLGNNAVQTRYSYYAWNNADQGGKLQCILEHDAGGEPYHAPGFELHVRSQQ
jgi:hypothetical protein